MHTFNHPTAGAVGHGPNKKGEVRTLISIGGLSLTSKVQRLAQKCLGGKAPIEGVDPDKTAAYGTVVHDGIFSGNTR